jgi:molybdopterin-guanine dinucleotide biosynthesis protein A
MRASERRVAERDPGHGVPRSAQPPLGVVLAGGAGRRLGGSKAAARLGGRPLAAWVAEALASVAEEVVIAAKEGSAVPALDGVKVWREPVEPVHPLAGVAWALRRAAGRDVLVCAVDLPFCAEAVRAVAAAAAGSGAADGAPIVVAEGQPLLGVYRGAVATDLRAAVDAGRPARAAVAGLGAVEVAVPDPERTLLNVNTPDDLARAEAIVRGA